MVEHLLCVHPAVRREAALISMLAPRIGKDSPSGGDRHSVCCSRRRTSLRNAPVICPPLVYLTLPQERLGRGSQGRPAVLRKGTPAAWRPKAGEPPGQQFGKRLVWLNRRTRAALVENGRSSRFRRRCSRRRRRHHDTGEAALLARSLRHHPMQRGPVRCHLALVAGGFNLLQSCLLHCCHCSQPPNWLSPVPRRPRPSRPSLRCACSWWSHCWLWHS